MLGLILGIRVQSGRSQGRIVVRHKGNGLKNKYRLIDFFRGISYYLSFRVIDLLYDPIRTSNIALILYTTGVFSYILATVDMYRFGIFGGNHNSHMLNSGSINFLKMFRRGWLVNSISKNQAFISQQKKIRAIQNFKAIYARSAGASALILGSYLNIYILVKLASNRHRLFFNESLCISGQNSNILSKFTNQRKAGVSRLLNIRPTVRGVAMNPIDHPHGGGEGKSSGGRHPVSPWARLTKDARRRNLKGYTTFFNVLYK